MSKLHALLIGIDCYLPNRLPDGGYYPSLGGCVRDINHVEDFLIRKLSFSRKDILKLSSSWSSDLNEPSEPKEKWPTYKNMVNAFWKLISAARSGDQVYIHYAGHGGRVRTLLPKIKGEHGLDETLVPMDIGNSESRHLRDIEMAKLLQNMTDKKLIVTIVLDSCNSGGATRGRGGAAIRGINSIDTTPRSQHSLVGSINELSNTWQGILELDRASSRKIDTGSGWLPEPKGYVLLAACRPSENAYEYPFEGNEKNGALTYWLLKSLEQLDKGLTYKQIHDRLVAKIHSQFELQTPMLEGDGDRVIFGNEYVRPIYAVNVMKVDINNGFGKQVLLNAGQVHGVREGSEFAIYPYRFTDFNRVSKRVALAKIIELGATDSWAKITKNFERGLIEQGAQAVIIDPFAIRLRRMVRLICQDEITTSESIKTNYNKALKQIENYITTEGKGFLELAKGDCDKADYQVAVNVKGEYEIWDPAGNAISNLNPPLKIDRKDAASLVVQRLTHLTKYSNIQQLDNLDSASPLARKLIVELFSLPQGYDPAVDRLPDHLQRVESEGNTKIVKEGQKLMLRVQNGMSKESKQVINIAILDLQPDWGIRQIYPPGAGESFIPIDAGQAEPFQLQAMLPASYKSGKDIIKVFATVGESSFRWLELPSLDKPLDVKRAAIRGAPSDPLEQLLAALTEDKASTRQLNPAASPSKEWTTAQIEVQIMR
jgi:hypothetical protein